MAVYRVEKNDDEPWVVRIFPSADPSTGRGTRRGQETFARQYGRVTEAMAWLAEAGVPTEHKSAYGHLLDKIAEGYRRHVTLYDEEFAVLAAAMSLHPRTRLWRILHRQNDVRRGLRRLFGHFPLGRSRRWQISQFVTVGRSRRLGQRVSTATGLQFTLLTG
jgi:hypothetical protein